MRIGIQTWGSDGDIRPFIALAGGLVKKGHEVSLVITSVDGKDYSSFAGAGRFQICHTASPALGREVILRMMRKLVRSRDVFTQLQSVLRLFFDPLVDEMYSQSKKLCETSDLLIGHFVCHPLKAAADKAGKRHATVTLIHLGVPSRFKSPLGLPTPGEWFNPLWWALAKSVTNWALKRRVNHLRVREGLAATRDVLDDILFSRTLNLLAVSPVFCTAMSDWAGRHHVCGFFNIEEETEEWQMPHDLKAFLRDGSPPVYMTFGSMLSVDPDPGKITNLLVEAALRAHTRAIIQSRWGEIHDIPDHPDIYRIEKAPHHYIFPDCAAVVHHGGAGTTHSATRCGCPSVVVQHFLDQRFWGRELRNAGVAPPIHDRRNVTPRKLARSIEVVLRSAAMKTRAEELGRMMRMEHGVERAIELIETLTTARR